MSLLPFPSLQTDLKVRGGFGSVLLDMLNKTPPPPAAANPESEPGPATNGERPIMEGENDHGPPTTDRSAALHEVDTAAVDCLGERNAERSDPGVAYEQNDLYGQPKIGVSVEEPAVPPAMSKPENQTASASVGGQKIAEPAINIPSPAQRARGNHRSRCIARNGYRGLLTGHWPLPTGHG